MKGTVRRRGDTWSYQFQVTSLGERRYVTKGGFRTRRECDHALHDAMAMFARGGPSAPSRRTLADYLEREWLPLQQARLRPSTFHGYRRVTRQQIIPLLGNVRLGDLTGGDVTIFLRELRSSTPRRKGAPRLSEQSIKRAYRVLHAALQHAVELTWSRRTRRHAYRAPLARDRRARRCAHGASRSSAGSSTRRAAIASTPRSCSRRRADSVVRSCSVCGGTTSS